MRTTRMTSAARLGRLMVLGLAATAGLALLPALLAGAPAGAAGGAAPVDATISYPAFSPNPLTIPVGATVRWTNNDSFPHTVTADDRSFDSGDINGGGTFTHTFNQAVTISYHCTIHSNMRATIKVVADSTTTTTAAPPTTTTTTAAPTTATTARATTTTTAAPATTTTGAPNPGGATGGTAAPTTATSAPRSTTTKPAAPSTTRSTAAPTTATQPPAAAGPPPGPAGTPPSTGAGSPDTTPSPQVAAGVTTRHAGGGGAGPAVWLGLLAALILGLAGGWALLRRSAQRG
jgi:plastocyanin